MFPLDKSNSAYSAAANFISAEDTRTSSNKTNEKIKTERHHFRFRLRSPTEHVSRTTGRTVRRPKTPAPDRSLSKWTSPGFKTCRERRLPSTHTHAHLKDVLGTPQKRPGSISRNANNTESERTPQTFGSTNRRETRNDIKKKYKTRYLAKVATALLGQRCAIATQRF